MKLDIRRKVLLLVLSGSLLTFMLMTVFFAVNMIHARKAMDDQTEELANGAAEYAAEMLEAGIKKRLEEICGLMNERAARREGNPLLSQLTLIVKEDGTLTLHLRDDGQELDPFRLSAESVNPESKQIEDVDVRALGLHAVKTHVRQYLYRNYHGFNTITLTV